MSQPFIGDIRLFAGNFAPRGYAFCNGQLLSIAENTALFSLIGTTYGGDGQVTFALPNLQSRVPIHMGQGPGLSNYDLGQAGGAENVTLITNQMPSHNHTANCNTAPGATTPENPTNSVWASSGGQAAYTAAAAQQPMNGQAIGLAGGNQPHDNMLPYQAVNYIIALEGIYPSRN